MNLIYCDGGNKGQRNVIEYSKEQQQINLLTLETKLNVLRATHGYTFSGAINFWR